MREVLLEIRETDLDALDGLGGGHGEVGHGEEFDGDGVGVC